jgi:hypothetical protein
MDAVDFFFVAKLLLQCNRYWPDAVGSSVGERDRVCLVRLAMGLAYSPAGPRLLRSMNEGHSSGEDDSEPFVEGCAVRVNRQKQPLEQLDAIPDADGAGMNDLLGFLSR